VGDGTVPQALDCVAQTCVSGRSAAFVAVADSFVAGGVQPPIFRFAVASGLLTHGCRPPVTALNVSSRRCIASRRVRDLLLPLSCGTGFSLCAQCSTQCRADLQVGIPSLSLPYGSPRTAELRRIWPRPCGCFCPLATLNTSLATVPSNRVQMLSYFSLTSRQSSHLTFANRDEFSLFPTSRLGHQSTARRSRAHRAATVVIDELEESCYKRLFRVRSAFEPVRLSLRSFPSSVMKLWPNSELIPYWCTQEEC
jgi:hypothetical protein